MKFATRFYSIFAVIFFFGLSACAVFQNTQPRTVDEAKRQFDQGLFIIGKTTQTEVQKKLGSPNEIKKKEDGHALYIYVKSVEVNIMAITSDIGTNYTAEYLFDSKGVLLDSNYRAMPMANPMLSQ